MINIQILLFGPLKERFGFSRRDQQVPEATTPSDLMKFLVSDSTPAEPLMRSTKCAVNRQFTSLCTPLSEGDEVAFIPPVAGG